MKSHSILLIADKILFAGAPVLGVTFISRYYGLEDFAYGSFWFSMYGVALAVISVSYEPIIYEALHKKNGNKIQAIFLVSAAIASVLALVVISSGHNIVDARYEHTKVSLATSIFLTPLYLSETFLRYNREYLSVFRVRLAVTMGFAVGKFMLANNSSDFGQFFTLSMIEYVVSPMIFSVILLHRKRTSLRISRTNKNTNNTDTRELLMAAASAGLVIFYTRTPQLLLNYDGSAEQRAVFNAAFLVITSLNIFTSAAYLRLMKGAIEEYSNEPNIYYANANKVLNWISMGAILIIPVLAMFGPAVQQKLFPISVTVEPMLYFTLGLYLMIITNALVRAQLVVILKMQEVNFVSAIMAIFFVYGLYFYADQYDALEAAKGLALSALISGILTSFIFPPLRRMGRLQIRALIPYKFKAT